VQRLRPNWRYKNNTRLEAFFQDNLAKLAAGESFWVLMKQEMMEWQWHQLERMQVIFTLLQTNNLACTSSVIFKRPNALPESQPIVSKC